MTTELEQLQDSIESAGYRRGTQAFDQEYRRQKVAMCKDRQGVASCWDCQAFDHCELIKARLRDLHHVDP